MSWDGKERRSDDHASRLASLEVYSKTQHQTIRDLSSELKNDIRVIRLLIESISKDVHAVTNTVHSAKVGGRMLLAIATVIGGAIGAVIAYLR